MAVKEFANVFSRYFVVGFYLPAFAGLVVLWQAITSDSLPPAVFRDASTGGKVLILGGLALMLALLLSGLHYPIVRFLEGYPLRRWRDRFTVLGVLDKKMTGRWDREFERLSILRNGPHQSPERTNAARELNVRFPAQAKHILPTRLGNVIRAFETHPRKRYGFDGVSAWPRIELLLTDGERADVAESKGDFAFFVNALVVTVTVALLLVIERLWRIADAADSIVALVVICIVAGTGAIASYFAAVGAAVRWGEPVRAAFDLHRFDLYARLGLKRPVTQAQEMEVGRAMSRLFAFAEPAPNHLRAVDLPSKEGMTPDQKDR